MLRMFRYLTGTLEDEERKNWIRFSERWDEFFGFLVTIYFMNMFSGNSELAGVL